jgi:beta-glucosidase
MEPVEQRINKLLSKMTLDEKLAQIGSYWFFDLQSNGMIDWEKAENLLQHGIGQITRTAGASMLQPVDVAKIVNGLQKLLIEQTRLGIPAIFHEECCCGVLILGGTTYPQMLGLASTFQPELAEAMTTEIRKQLLAIGARQGLAPVLDIGRDPRWGRVEETFGEDPTLVSHFGVAYIKGLQSENPAEGVMATGKHFIGHSLSQGGLNCAPVHIGMRELRDILLPPFQAAIRDAGLASMMNAYPELDGEVVAASRQILTELLREELGFDGLMVSDYEAVIMLDNFHRVAADPASAACMALTAGIDVELPNSVCYSDPLKSALDRGEINIEFVDLAVRRHLEKKFALGLFDNPFVDEGKVLEVFETPEQRMLAREIARKSMVLLKNDGILPLPQTVKTIAVIGPNADDGRNQLGDYSYAAMTEFMQLRQPENSAFIDHHPEDRSPDEIKVLTVLDGIRSMISPETKILLKKGCETFSNDVSGIDEAVELAEQADAIVLVLGDKSGLTPNCTTGETRDSSDLKLPGVQEDLAEALFAIKKPIVVVLVTGRPYVLSGISQSANAILQAWLPGEEGGAAVAEVLFGQVNPGGKLPVSFPRSAGQLPLNYNAKPAGMKSHWYGDYVSESVTPLYPFGYGLSYTSFEYRDLSISRNEVKGGEIVDISFSLENLGHLAGEETPQLYIHDEVASTPRPGKELKGYQRIKLEAGEIKRITFHLPVDQLAFHDIDMNLAIEAGLIEVMVGNSSEDIRLNGSFTIVENKTLAINDRVFVCPVTVI